MVFVYFAFIESGLTHEKTIDNLRTSTEFFALVIGLVIAFSFSFGIRFVLPLPLWKHTYLSFGTSDLNGEERSAIIDNLLNLPLRSATVSLVGWITAGMLYGIYPELYRTSADVQWYPALRSFLGIVFVGAPFTVVSQFLALEWMVRKTIEKIFGSDQPLIAPRSLGINVLPRMVTVSLLIGTVPVSIVSLITLNQIETDKDRSPGYIQFC